MASSPRHRPPPSFDRSGSSLYQLLVESVEDYAIFALDTQGNVLSWNQGAERFKGYTDDEIIGKHYSVFYPVEEVAAGRPERLLQLATARGHIEDEGWRVRKDGTQFWADVTITALRDPTGELVGYAKVTRDLTERKIAEQRGIADARRIAEAEFSNRAKSEFLAALSHELRTPLNAIGGYAELMEIGVAGPVTDQQREYLARIQNGQQHLLSIINDLLNYSRIEAGQVSYESELIDMHALVETVLELITPQAARKRISVTHETCDQSPIARADRVKTEQILLNLLSNAVKFTADGGSVTTTCGVAETGAFVTVADTGTGIPVDKLSAIFEPFVQLSRSLSSTREGTGLGLAISRDLARAMGGNITVESRVGSGSRFKLTLPRT